MTGQDFITIYGLSSIVVVIILIIKQRIINKRNQ